MPCEKKLQIKGGIGPKGLEIKGFQTFDKNSRLMGPCFFVFLKYKRYKQHCIVETIEVRLDLRDKGTTVLRIG